MPGARRPASDESRWRHGATLLGISFEAYRAFVLAGLKWCSGCRAWEARSLFGPHRRYPDGLNSQCARFSRENARRSMAALRKRRALEALS